jgi:uncharacterized protein YjbI with pentapeptide repeats
MSSVVAQVTNASEHLAHGSDFWNRWRELNPDVLPVLRHVHLRDVSLRHVNLRGVIGDGLECKEVDFTEATLEDGSFAAAVFCGCRFDRAAIRNASFVGADLTDARLETAIGLKPEQFAGADLGGAQFPPSVKFASVSIANDTAANARRLFHALVIVCLYTLLTIAGTDDLSLLKGVRSLQLPILNTAVNDELFFGVAPLIVLVSWLYFHVYLIQFVRLGCTYPRVFTDGTKLRDSVFPWIFNVLVPSMRSPSGDILQTMERFAVVALGYCLAPVTLLSAFIRYLPKQNIWVSTWQLVLVIGVLVLTRVIASTLRQCGDYVRRSRGRAVREVLAWLAILSWFGLLFVWRPELSSLSVAGKMVSTRPPSTNSDGDGVSRAEGVMLTGRRLRRLNGSRAFFVRTDLTAADVRAAEFRGSDLRMTDFRNADLRDAVFVGADCRGANFSGAIFGRTDFRGSDLRGAVGICLQASCGTISDRTTRLP